jgi:hypothetical protein
MELTAEEKRIILKHREAIEKTEATIDIMEHILQEALNYAKWRRETGVMMSYSSFRNNYGHNKEFKVGNKIIADNKFIFENIAEINKTLNNGTSSI